MFRRSLRGRRGGRISDLDHLVRAHLLDTLDDYPLARLKAGDDLDLGIATLTDADAADNDPVLGVDEQDEIASLVELHSLLRDEQRGLRGGKLDLDRHELAVDQQQLWIGYDRAGDDGVGLGANLDVQEVDYPRLDIGTAVGELQPHLDRGSIEAGLLGLLAERQQLALTDRKGCVYRVAADQGRERAAGWADVISNRIDGVTDLPGDGRIDIRVAQIDLGLFHGGFHLEDHGFGFRVRGCAFVHRCGGNVVVL